jgi:chaperonin cofactor prefoldin
MAVSVKGNTSSIVYGKGDICLKLNPFDNFRLFTLYEDWRSDDRKPIDLSNGQKIYLVFKSRKKEIRIPEYDLIDSEYTVDKVNGQVLFKISKKNAIDALAMDTDIFYITRVYDVTDSTGNKVTSSEEEVLYTGKFKDETSNTIDNYTSQVKNMMNIVEDRNGQIADLQESNVELIKQNADLSVQNADLQDEIQKLNSRLDELETALAEYQSGNEYEGKIIDDNATHHTYITGLNAKTGKEFTEEELSNALKSYEESIQS